MRTELTITRPTLDRAMQAAGCDPDAAARTWGALADEPSGARLQGRAVSTAWYAGGFISITAMSAFLGQGWASGGPIAGAAILTVYAVVFIALAELFHARRLTVPAGLMATVAVALTPALVYAACDLTIWAPAGGASAPGDYPDVYAYINSGWVLMEAATVLASALAWRRYGLPITLSPGMVAGWFAAMDLADAFAGNTARTAASAAVAVALLALGVLADRRGLRGGGFWAHLGGLLAASYTLSAAAGSAAVVMTVTGVLAVLAAVAAVLLGRRLYLVAAAAWALTATGYLTLTVFGGSLLWPVVLAAVGVGVVLSGVRLDRAVARPSSVARAA